MVTWVWFASLYLKHECVLSFLLAKNDLRCVVASCDVRACGAFLGLRSAIATLHVFSNVARYEDLNALYFGVNYNSVAQKLRILAVKAIFDPKKTISD